MTSRIVAILVMLASAGIVAYHHRDVFAFPSEVASSPEEAAFQACFQERSVDIDKMVNDGVIQYEQAKLFKLRVPPKPCAGIWLDRYSSVVSTSS